MSTPQIRVRLSPEGVADVIEALRRVTAETKQAQQLAGKGVGAINTALRELKSLLPAIGLAAVVGGFAAMTGNALRAADATGKLQQAVGGTVEEISGLTLAFRTNESNQDQLRAALLKTANVMGEVRAGSAGARDGLAGIGLDADKIATLSTPRALEQIAKQLLAIEDPGKRAAAAAKIFGKQAGDLLTALKAVGTQGIDPFIKKAAELGVLIDSDLADAAARANDSLGIIKLQAEGLATQFAAGLAPAVADAMEELNRATTGPGINGFRKLGEFVGFLINGIVAGFSSLGKTIGATIAQIVATGTSAVEAAKALARGSLSGAREALQAGARERLAIETALQEDLAALQARLDNAGNKRPPPDPRGNGVAGAVDPDFALEQERKNAAATATLKQQAFQNELKLQQEFLKSQEQANQVGFDQGLVSLQQFYDKRKALAERNNQIEIASLRGQRAAVVEQLTADKAHGGPDDEADRIKLRQQIAQLDSQIQQRRVAGERELAGLLAERTAAEKDLAKELADQQANLLEIEGNRHAAFMANLAAEVKLLRELDAKAGKGPDQTEADVQRLVAARTAAFNKELNGELQAQEIKLLELEGRRHDAFRANLDVEIAQLREFGRRAGQTADEIDAQVRRFSAAREAAFNFDEVQRKGADALAAFDRDAQQIQRDQQAGIITQFEGEQRLIDLERERLVVLKELAQQQLLAAEATGNPEIIERARQFAASVDQISASYTQATDIAGRFRSAGLEAFEQGIQSLALNIDKIHSFGDAFKELARTVGAALSKIAADIIARQATLALLNLIPGGAGSFGAFLSGAKDGGRIRGYAGGGDVRGRKLNVPGPDKIPIMAQEGEFMIRQRAAAQPGGYAFLRAFNAGLIRPQALPKFALGGPIGGMIETAGAGGTGRPGMVVQQSFHMTTDRQGNVSRRTTMQITAAAARGLAEASERNN